jgi:alanine dehydrogenase
MSLLVIGGEDVRAHLTPAVAIPLIDAAMRALSCGDAQQDLRQIVPLKSGAGVFGLMPGALGGDAGFGAKLVTVFQAARPGGHTAHQGLICLFDPVSGAPVCILPAAEITAIRTAAASAVATDALARRDASRLAILGCGEQAEAHLAAIPLVRDIKAVTVWGRSTERASAFAARVGARLSIPIRVAETASEAVRDADIVCTTTAAQDPIIDAGDIAAGCHVNAVGSSRAGPAELGGDLVARSRFFVDHRASALSQAAEFLEAKAAGLVNDDHILAEIGEVLLQRHPGRGSETEITIYKSLGSIVQDLASGWFLYERALRDGFGEQVAL